MITDHKSPIPPPYPPPCCPTLGPGDSDNHRPERPKCESLQIFSLLGRRRKNKDFSNLQKSKKIAKSIDLVAPKSHFWTRMQDFWAPFWHRFFYFVRKWRKCVTGCASAWALTQIVRGCRKWLFAACPHCIGELARPACPQRETYLLHHISTK